MSQPGKKHFLISCSPYLNTIWRTHRYKLSLKTHKYYLIYDTFSPFFAYYADKCRGVNAARADNVGAAIMPRLVKKLLLCLGSVYCVAWYSVRRAQFDSSCGRGDPACNVWVNIVMKNCRFYIRNSACLPLL